jgi:hypothetical protein
MDFHQTFEKLLFMIIITIPARGLQLPAINRSISPKKVLQTTAPKVRYMQRNMPLISQASMDTDTWKELQKLLRPIVIGSKI